MFPSFKCTWRSPCRSKFAIQHAIIVAEIIHLCPCRMYLEREIRTFPNPYIGKLATLHSCNSCISKNSEWIRAPDVSIAQVYMMLARPVGLILIQSCYNFGRNHTLLSVSYVLLDKENKLPNLYIVKLANLDSCRNSCSSNSLIHVQMQEEEQQHQQEEVAVSAPQFDEYLQHYGGGNAGHRFESNKGANADHDFLHGHTAGAIHNFRAPVQHYHEAFLKPFLPAQRPGSQRPDSGHHHLQLVTKFTHKVVSPPAVQCGALSSSEKKILQYKNMNEASLDSPCSVISGFTKALSSGTDYMDTFGTASTSATVQELQKEGMSTPSHHHVPNYAVGEILMSRHSRSTSESHMEAGGLTNSMHQNSTVQRAKRKRTRTRTPKQGDEVESQRMTHIAVERNRRKQMNEHLASLRALMPGSYVQKVTQPESTLPAGHILLDHSCSATSTN